MEVEKEEKESFLAKSSLLKSRSQLTVPVFDPLGQIHFRITATVPIGVVLLLSPPMF